MLNLSVPWVLACSLFLASFLIYFPYAVVAYGRFQAGFDIAAPRALFDKLSPMAQRAAWAHQNSFETFSPFAAAVLVALVAGVTSTTAEIAAIAFVISRFFYSICYIANIPLGRSLMFGVGTAATITIFLEAINKLSPA
ncbi:MAPEG family protein [Synechococcus sp. PCC 6312]|uniref:MAPEG family protein n=1 Tax=Synechococcus sp. (strain ATCC 27167 / PCC 6312) TaxID=195253 RepID=UPI00029F2A5F|nr:MAPEG family protein [Synechococcus sp. PCC 6312]AFY61381.1 putative membrane protein [Synechococcus sp. PCC 6312]